MREKCDANSRKKQVFVCFSFVETTLYTLLEKEFYPRRILCKKNMSGKNTSRKKYFDVRCSAMNKFGRLSWSLAC